MDDAINTSSFRQPNTFMDVMGPNKSPRRGEPHRSSTLMRSAVKRPEPTIAQIQNRPEIQNGFNRTDHLEAASQTAQSPFISRVATSIYDEQPEQAYEPEVAPIETHYSSIEEEPLEAIIPVEPEPIMPGPEGIAEAVIPAPNFNVFSPQTTLNTSFIESAGDGLRNGAKKVFSMWTVLGVAIIGIIASAVFINNHLTNVEFYLASSKVGFTATMPSIKPSGYDLAGISTGSGVIETSFKSNTDGRAYTISEKQSNMTSGSLQNGYVTNQAGLNYQTLTAGSKTIYVYGSHNATWVSGGIWYVIQDNNSLSYSQIINIANSM